MKNKTLYYYLTIALIFLGVIPIKAVIHIYPNYNLQNGSITEDGITISGVKYYVNSHNIGPMPSAFGTTNFTISSNVGNIVMIGISYSPYYFYEEEAANNGVGDYNNETNYRQIRSEYLGGLVSSEGTIENGGGFSGDYSLWRGSSNNISFNCNTQLYVASFHIYLEGDELPEKKPFTSRYHYHVYNFGDGPDEDYNTLTLDYDYVDFLENYISGGTWSTSRINNVFCEGESIPGPTSSSEDASDFYNEIGGSFSDYKPHNISKMFKNVKCISPLDYLGINLSEVNNASYMFENSNVVVKNLHIDEGENLSYMFSGYANKSIDISSWSFSSNTIVTGMFSNSSIQFLTVGPSINNARNDIFNGLGTYSNPCKLEIIGDVDLGQSPDSNVFYWKGGYFILPQKEAYVSVEEEMYSREPAFHKKYVNRSQNQYSYYYTFRYDTRKSIYAKTFSLDEVVQDGCYEIKKWVADFNSLYENKGDDYWYIYENESYKRIANVVLAFDPSFADYRPTSTKGWFFECEAESIGGLKYLNTSNVTSMSQMFANCFNLTSLNVSNFNTSNVTDMCNMFSNCINLTSLDVSNFNTSNVTTMAGMFDCCSNLTSLNVSNFNTSNVTTMTVMFQGCSNLTSLDVSNFNTSKVTGIYGMFRDCINLTSLDLRNFNTSKVINMAEMFERCSNLTSLDVSNFNTSNVTDMHWTFKDCKKLTSLDVSIFNTSKLMEGDYKGSYEMFSNCSSLQELSISITMANIQENACQRVGTKGKPCTIYAPYGFDFGTDTSQPYFIWKNGFFVKGADIAYAANSWKATEDTPTAAGTTLVDDDLLTAKTVYGTTLKSSAISFADQDFTHYIQVRVSALPTAENVYGTVQDGSTPISLTAKKNIKLTVYFRRQSTEQTETSGVFAAEDGKDLKCFNQADATPIPGELTIVQQTEDFKYGFATKVNNWTCRR